MSGSEGCMEGLQQPKAEVLTQVEPVVASEAAGIPGRLDCSSSLGGGRVNLRLPLTTSRMEGRTAGAACPV